MNTIRAWSAIALATMLSTGCGLVCDAEEQRTVTFSTDPTFQIQRPGDAISASLQGSLSNYDNNPAFETIFKVVDDGSAQGAIQISMSGRHPLTDEVIGLTVLLPTPVRGSDVFTVDSTFQVPFSTPLSETQNWAVRGARPAGKAAVAFRTAIYSFPPSTFTDTYLASASAGTIRVTRRGGDDFQMEFALTFTDAAGRPASITGRAQVTTSRYTPSCIS